MNSIRRRLTRDVLAISAALLGGSLIALYFAARTELEEQFDAALQAKALVVSTAAIVAGGQDRLDLPDNLLPAAAEGEPQDYYEVWDGRGSVLARSPSLGLADLFVKRGSMAKPRFWNLRLPGGQTGRAIGLILQLPRQNAETVSAQTPSEIRLVVASGREDFDEALNSLLGIAGACAVLLLAAMLWAVPRVLRRGLAPLDRLGEQAAKIDANTLAARFPTAGLPAELEPISVRLNALLARLETSLVRERRFSADLAHELRTPVAELRSLAECALKWPETRDTATDRETLAIARQMEALVTHMLALARGEHEQINAQREPMAVDAVVREVWRLFAARAEARGLRADLKLAAATAAVDPALLRSILANLFDNAADYTPPGGVIRVAVEGIADEVRVRIANVTDNFEAADVEKLFDRYWRKEAARSGGRHSGLGLPLARMFALAMGWSLTAALDGEHWLEFTLVGPVTAGE